MGMASSSLSAGGQIAARSRLQNFQIGVVVRDVLDAHRPAPLS
jgi:hypothetical protein